MKILPFLAVLVFAIIARAEEQPPAAAPPYYRVHYEPSQQPGELIFGVSYTVWIPPDVKVLRGVILHQHGCGEGACKAGQTAAFDLHWQALARKYRCALLGPSYEQPEKAVCAMWCDPRNGSETRFLQALNDLAAQSHHPELATVPWALWGHSGGATWVGTMLMLHPERVVAVWLRSGTPRLVSPDGKRPALEIPAAAYAVPAMCNLGTKEGVTQKDGKFAHVWDGVRPFFEKFRAKGGLIGVAVDPNSSHDCGNSRYLAIPWFDACLAARLPERAGDALKPMPLDGVWRAPLLGDAPLPTAQFHGDVNAAVWLPNERVAKAWAEYVKDGNVSDTTPPPAPTHVRLSAMGELTWEADADVESGLAGFIVERDGVELAHVPEKPAGSIGRKIFQKNNYSDTPTLPLASMRFTDLAYKAGEKHVYRVLALNRAGLKSEPSPPAVGLAVECAATSPSAAQPVSGPLVKCRHGVVVSASAPASEIGCEILRRGGNAVDAAVATAFALAVAYPEAGNIGGGGFMLVYPAPGTNEEPVVVDYRETAPAAATKNMFADGNRSSHLLVGVPGTVRGLAMAHKRYGKLSWKELVSPAANLATNGFAIDAPLARSLNSILRSSAQSPEFIHTFAKNRENPGEIWHTGDRLAQQDLGRTLTIIADEGPDAFYTGSIAEALVEEVRSGGGIVSRSDLSNYQAKLRPAVHGTYRGYDVYSAPPPSSGGIALIEMLNILENFNLRIQGRWSPLTLHLIVEAMRRAYADRACYLGDPDFVKTPEELTSKEYGKQLASGIDVMRATKSETIAKDKNIVLSGESGETTHFSVVDGDGMAVSNTYTLEHSWGGRLVVKGKGFLLNNEMGDFNPKPGTTNRQGMIGTVANQIEPGKRMLSSMSPTIVAKNGHVVLVTGSPGGRTIINTELCVTLNFLEFDMSPREAIDAPRMQHQWFPDELHIEQPLPDGSVTAIETLRQMGHVVAPGPWQQGDAHSIWVEPSSGSYVGVADQRRSGAASGY